jgi:hypothetical protein
VERCVDWCWCLHILQFFPSLTFSSSAAMVVAGRKVEDGWQLKEVYPPATYALMLARIWFLLLFGGKHAVAMFAAMICGRSGGPSRRQSGISSTSLVEAPSRASRRSPMSFRRQVVRPRRCQDGRRWRLITRGEDQGRDCFSCFILRVFCAIIQDYAVIFHFFQCPVCKMYPLTVL